MLIAVPATVFAAHQFPDVPNTNPFHDDIGAIAEAGITAGFGDGGYHPTEAVTRQAMAAFLHRGFGRIAHDGDSTLNNSVDVNAGSTFSLDVAAKQVTIKVPGATNAFSPKQIVWVHARVELQGSMSTSGAGCPCQFGAVIMDATDNTFSPTAHATFESTSNSSNAYSWDVDAAFVVPPGDRAFQLLITLLDRDTTTNSRSFGISDTSTLTAMTFPFGSDGTNELNP
jgi:hypothetical protein